jgi:hypothetical protein
VPTRLTHVGRNPIKPDTAVGPTGVESGWGRGRIVPTTCYPRWPIGKDRAEDGAIGPTRGRGRMGSRPDSAD